jgi:hypothetical protein
MLSGIDETPRADDLFTEQQLELLTDSGVWLLSAENGVTVTVRGLTTAAYGDPAEHDESVVANLDSINKELRTELEAALSMASASNQVQHLINARLRGRLNALSVTKAPRLGRQVFDSDIRVVRRHAYLNDRIVLSVRLVVPVPQDRGSTYGNAEVYQQIIV